MTDFGSQHTELWFDGEVQKIVSVSASIATAAFNRAREADFWKESLEEILGIREYYQEEERGKVESKYAQLSLALFDSRVWQIAPRIEVYNAFLWRQNDATRNAISHDGPGELLTYAVTGKIEQRDAGDARSREGDQF